MLRNSLYRLAREALSGHRNWPRFWREAQPRERYDIVIVGGGGHGLATAYYLAKEHGIRNVAVLEQAWIGGGNSGRNTQIIRSNYLAAASAAFYDHSLRLYEGLSRELNYNIMFSQRGVVNLATSRAGLNAMNRRVNALRHAGIDAEMLTTREVQELMPRLRVSSPSGRRVHGGFIQRRGGIARHDAVVWGYARAANALGVDIIQNCEVTGFEIDGGGVSAVLTRRGRIATRRVGLAVAGSSSLLAAKLGFQLPINSMTLQAMVSEPVRPVLNVVLDGAFYVSQSDRGELVMGGGTDVYTSYGQRGAFTRVEANMAALLDLFPDFAGLKLMRQWGGVVDTTPDSSPIIDASPVKGIYLNCGWGTYGFKAIPAGGSCFAGLLATQRPHALIDEGASSGMDDKEHLL
jgi:sarcosine oxidase subunit beta